MKPTRWQRFRALLKQVYGSGQKSGVPYDGGTLHKRGGHVRMPNVPPPPRATSTPPPPPPPERDLLPPPPGYRYGGHQEVPGGWPRKSGPSGIAVSSDFLLAVEEWCEQAATRTSDPNISGGLCSLADRANVYRMGR